MLVSKFLERLAQGPVGDIKEGGDRSGVIPSTSLGAMINRLNTGLNALHARFPLQLKTLVIQCRDGRFEYPLLKAHAATDTSEPMADKFIIDSLSRPFTGDVLAIEHVLDNNECELPLNDRRNPMSWFTSSYNTLIMGYPTQGTEYFVQYRGEHALLHAGAGYENQVVNIPTTLEDALLSRVAYEVFHARTDETSAVKAADLLSKFELICQQREQDNVLNTSIVDDRAQQFAAKGFC